MANFNPYQFTNLHYSPDFSQYGDGLFLPFGSSFDRAFEHRQAIQPSTFPSVAPEEAKQSNQGKRWSVDVERVLLA